MIFVIGSTTKNKFLELNQIVAAKYLADGCFYRAKVIDKIDDNNYNAIFIDFGFEDNVYIADIILLPIELQQVKFDHNAFISFYLIKSIFLYI